MANPLFTSEAYDEGHVEPFVMDADDASSYFTTALEAISLPVAIYKNLPSMSKDGIGRAEIALSATLSRVGIYGSGVTNAFENYGTSNHSNSINYTREGLVSTIKKVIAFLMRKLKDFGSWMWGKVKNLFRRKDAVAKAASNAASAYDYYNAEQVTAVARLYEKLKSYSEGNYLQTFKDEKKASAVRNAVEKLGGTSALNMKLTHGGTMEFHVDTNRFGFSEEPLKNLEGIVKSLNGGEVFSRFTAHRPGDNPSTGTSNEQFRQATMQRYGVALSIESHNKGLDDFISETYAKIVAEINALSGGSLPKEGAFQHDVPVLFTSSIAKITRKKGDHGDTITYAIADMHGAKPSGKPLPMASNREDVLKICKKVQNASTAAKEIIDRVAKQIQKGLDFFNKHLERLNGSDQARQGLQSEVADVKNIISFYATLQNTQDFLNNYIDMANKNVAEYFGHCGEILKATAPLLKSLDQAQGGE